MKFWFSLRGIAAGILLAGVIYFLLEEHREHFFTALPFLIFLMCPLSHYFMHRNHGYHGGDHEESR